jgi:hypothetical protein
MRDAGAGPPQDGVPPHQGRQGPSGGVSLCGDRATAAFEDYLQSRIPGLILCE